LNSSSQPTQLVHKICLLRWQTKPPNQRNFLHFAKNPKLIGFRNPKNLVPKITQYP
jgi:hypothetical protein